MGPGEQELFAYLLPLHIFSPPPDHGRDLLEHALDSLS